MSDAVTLPSPKRATDDEIVFDRASWEDFIEDLADLVEVTNNRAADAAYAAGLPPGTELTVPHEVVAAKARGAHPLAAWRGYRGLTQQQLAEASGASRDMIAQIETGKRIGAADTLAQLAGALNVPIEALLAPVAVAHGTAEFKGAQ